MPNYVTNRMTIEAESDYIDTILETIKGDETSIDFNKVISMPDELNSTSKTMGQETNPKLIDKYGADNWYDWNVKHWGTKWNACDSYVEDNTVVFDTAWSTPMDLIATMSVQFPKAKFIVEYADEDLGANCGIYTWQNGVDTFMDKSYEAYDDDGEEAVRWAMVVKYGSDDDYEEMYEEDED